MSEYQEPENKLSPLDLDFHRALTSIKEEVEAVDTYNQQAVASTDDTLKKILAHNRDEEIEHVCMALEWLRRNMPMWDKSLRAYLFTDEPITEIEKGEKAGNSGSGQVPGFGQQDLGIGSLKPKEPIFEARNNNISNERK